MSTTTVPAVDQPASDPQWEERAACRGTDTTAFYPTLGGSTAAAKKICGRCPVEEECLRGALDRNERFGVWGGMSTRERRKLKRQLA